MGGISRLGSPALHNAGAYRLQIVGAGSPSLFTSSAHDNWFTVVVLRADCPQRVPDFVCLWYDKGKGRPKTRLDI